MIFKYKYEFFAVDVDEGNGLEEKREFELQILTLKNL